MSPLKAIFNVLFPDTCACCGTVLVNGEHHICLSCLSDLSPIGCSAFFNNPLERKLLGRIDFEAGTALCRYGKDGVVKNAVHAMKFHGDDELCLMMGRLMAADMMSGGRFDDVDVLVPIPLHWLRRLQRGYNQSELLCRGIAEVLHRPVNTTAVVRHRYTRRQSRQSRFSRPGNVEGAFKLRHPEELQGRHVLLVDDVLTTGATLVACASVLQQVPGLRLSVAVFSMV